MGRGKFKAIPYINCRRTIFWQYLKFKVEIHYQRQTNLAKFTIKISCGENKLTKCKYANKHFGNKCVSLQKDFRAGRPNNDV